MGDKEQHVARVLRARHAFEVLELAVAEHDEGAVKRAYRRLALLLHPDKNSHEDAKLAFVRVADAYEQLRHPAGQRQALIALRKPSSHKGSGAATAAPPSSSSRRQQEPGAGAARKPRSFMDVLREWEEFEREFFEQEAQSRNAAERQHRAEKKRSQMADRAEREAAERQRLADAVLGEDDEALQARSNSWASFLNKEKKRRKTGRGGDGDGTGGCGGGQGRDHG